MKENIGDIKVYQGNDKLLFGLFLAVITLGLFAQTILNTATTLRMDLGIDVNASNIAVSAAALFSGIFIVVIGGLGDRLGRIRMTKIGLLLSILGSLIIAISPKGTAFFLIAGRIIQGLSTACILPNALAVIKAYYEGAARQRAISIYSIGSWGGAALSALFGGVIASSIGWRWIYWLSIVVAIGSFVLIAGVPESKNPVSDKKKAFDLAGMLTFIVGMLTINLVISQGSRMGWLSPLTLGLTAISVIIFLIFFKIEKAQKIALWLCQPLFPYCQRFRPEELHQKIKYRSATGHLKPLKNKNLVRLPKTGERARFFSCNIQYTNTVKPYKNLSSSQPVKPPVRFQ